MNKTDKVPVTGTTKAEPEYKYTTWFIVWPEGLNPECILAQRRVLRSVPLFLMTLMSEAPPAGDPLRPDQMFPVAAVLADRSGESWREGVLVWATGARAPKLMVLLLALCAAERKGLISAAESADAEAERLTMTELL